jgi:transcriptional regulator with XRE-family HTH domain
MAKKPEQARGAELLRRFLTEHHTSQTELAIALGVTAMAVSQWVNGNSTPGIRFAHGIAEWTKNAVPIESWIPNDAKAVKPFTAKGA